jgi:glutamate 5-kinase
MRSKILAARIATAAGLDAIIANGEVPHIIDSILEGNQVGTMFAAIEAAD